jgi:hypothetical protein
METHRIARPEDRLAAIRAYQENKLGISWGPFGGGSWAMRGFAERQGWPTHFWGFKGVFIAKMLESDKSFKLALINSGIDVYIPREY